MAEYFAANTIGMQMAAAGLGTAIIPGLMGVFARQISLEIIPVCLLAVYAGLLGLYLLAVKYSAMQPATSLRSNEPSAQ